MSNQGFPIFSGQPGLKIDNFKVTGANVSTVTAGSSGLDGRGQMTCRVIRSANTYTFTFLKAYGDIPYIQITPLTTNSFPDAPVITAQGFTFNSTQRDANGTPVNLADFQILIMGFNTTSYVS